MTASVDILAGGIRQTFTNQQMGWAVAFEGSIERTTEDITKFFGIPNEGTPFEIHLAAAALATSGQIVAEVLGGTPVVEQSAPTERESERTKVEPKSEQARTAEAQATKAEPAPENDPWAQAESESGSTATATPEPEPERDERTVLLDTIKATNDVDSLKRLYIENQASFKADADLMATWKARGKELSK